MLPRLVDETWVIELDGAVAQLGEHLLCKQGVSGSIPLSSTICFVLTLSRSYDRCAPDGPRHEARRTIVLYGRIDPRSSVAAIQRGSASPIVWRPHGAPSARECKLSSEEIKVCIVLLRIDACSEYIVKRRYVWKLPGVLSPCGLKRPSPVPEKP